MDLDGLNIITLKRKVFKILQRPYLMSVDFTTKLLLPKKCDNEFLMIIIKRNMRIKENDTPNAANT